MFQSIEELVDDNDCRHAREVEGLSNLEDDIECVLTILLSA